MHCLCFCNLARSAGCQTRLALTAWAAFDLLSYAPRKET